MGEDQFSSIPSDRAVEQAIVVLKKGAHLLKYRRGKPKFCSFKLSEDEKLLIWYSSQEEKQIRLASVSRIIPAEKDSQCFSIIYGNTQQSLDLICKDKKQAETWILGLRSVISRNSSPRILDSPKIERGSQSCISSPAGYMRRKQVLGLLADKPSSQVHSLSGSPSQSFSEKYFGDGLSCSSNRLYRESHMRNIMDIFIPKSPYIGPDEDQRRAVTEFVKPDDYLRDVLIWGKGVEGGYLGGGGRGLTESDALLPKVMESTLMLDVQTITLARNHAALVTKQGEVFSWGEGKRGRLGHKLEMDVTSPKIVESLSSVSVKSVACGEYKTCALTQNGELYTWGDDNGDDTRKSLWLPHKLSGFLDGLRISHVACGEWHTAIVSTCGRLFTYGDGTFGALGHGNLESVSHPKEIESLKGSWVKSVACGLWHTVAIVDRVKHNKPYGKLFTWGDGDKGRLGHSDQTRKLLPTCVSMLVDQDFVQVSCGRVFTIGLSITGKVYTMGNSSIGVVEGRLKDEFVREISSGCYHIAALTSTGRVYTWGSGVNGQLGVGDTKDRNSPTLVEALRDRKVLHITCGSSLTAVICLHKSVSSADQSACRGCNIAFKFTRKKHNCYNCGLSFCHACSSKKAKNASLATVKSKPFRVCDLCFNKLHMAKTPNSTASTPRPLKIITDKREETEPTSSRVRSTRNRPDETSTKVPDQETTHPRWGHVQCPEVFDIFYGENKEPPRMRNTMISPELRSVSSCPRYSDELSEPDKLLTEEVLKLQDQVKSLKSLCRSRKQKIEECQEKTEEAWALAKDEAGKSKAAKEVIRALTSRLQMMSQKVFADRDTKSRPCSSLGTPKPKGSVAIGKMEDPKLNSLSNSPIDFSSTRRSMHKRDYSGDYSTEKSIGTNPLKHERVEQFQPGVYITLTTTHNGQTELKRVRFSRRKFDDKEAERWWDENQSKVYRRYDIEE